MQLFDSIQKKMNEDYTSAGVSQVISHMAEAENMMESLVEEFSKIESLKKHVPELKKIWQDMREVESAYGNFSAKIHNDLKGH